MASRSAGILGIERADWPLAGAGAVLALALTVTASAMVLRADKRPLVYGVDHLSLFARPAQIHEERLRAQMMPAVAATEVLARTTPAPAATAVLDYAPTASITSSPPNLASKVPSSVVGAPTADRGYKLMTASKGWAVFRGPTGDITVRRGGVVPGVGRVTAIKLKDKAWTVTLGRVTRERANTGGANPDASQPR